MSDATEPPPANDADPELAQDGPEVWDAVDALRQRATATRSERDKAIAELRDGMSDQDILDDFGIHLGEIEQ